jgi:hypothetical protein
MSRRKEARTIVQHAARALQSGDALGTFPPRAPRAPGDQFAPFRDIAILASASNAAVDFAARSALSELDLRSRAIEAAMEANDARALATAENADAAIAAIEEASTRWLAEVRARARSALLARPLTGSPPTDDRPACLPRPLLYPPPHRAAPRPPARALLSAAGDATRSAREEARALRCHDCVGARVRRRRRGCRAGALRVSVVRPPRFAAAHGIGCRRRHPLAPAIAVERERVERERDAAVERERQWKENAMHDLSTADVVIHLRSFLFGRARETHSTHLSPLASRGSGRGGRRWVEAEGVGTLGASAASGRAALVRCINAAVC